VTPIFVRLLDQRSGAPVALPGEPRAVDREVHVALPGALGPGGFVVSYRVISLDSHPVEGAFLFGIGGPPPAASVHPAQPADSGWQAVVVLDRWLRSGALLALGGGVLFLALVGGLEGSLRRIRRDLTLAGGVAVATTVIAVGLQSGVLAAGPAAIILEPGTWAAGARTSLGTSFAVALAAIALVMAGLALRRRWGRRWRCPALGWSPVLR
jgi:copper transport protein